MFKITRRSFVPSNPKSIEQAVRLLPFVAFVRERGKPTGRNWWAVEPTTDHGYAQMMGAQYAADLIQFVRDNPDCAGSIIGHCVGDMLPHYGGATGHYATGFFAFIESLLLQHAAKHDIHAQAQAYADKVAAAINQFRG